MIKIPTSLYDKEICCNTLIRFNVFADEMYNEDMNADVTAEIDVDVVAEIDADGKPAGVTAEINADGIVDC